VKNLSEVERLLRVTEFMKSVDVAYHKEFHDFLNRKRDEPDCMRLLRALADRPWLPVTKLYESVNLFAADGVRAKDKLVKDGHVKEWVNHFVRRGSGSRPTFLGVTLSGVAVLKSIGITRFVMKGKGSDVAKIYLYAYLKRWAEKKGYRYEFEYWAESKQIDFVYWDEYQRLNAVEVCLSGSVEYNAGAAVACASLQGVHRVILACDDRKVLMNGVKARLKKELLPVQEKCQVVWLGDFWCGDE